MKNKAYSLLTAAAALLACNLFSPQGPATSQDAAAQRVLEEIVDPGNAAGSVIVFGWPAVLTPADQLVAFNPPEYTPASAPLEITGESWFFWIDDAPGARFAHPSRFVLVDQASGEISVLDEEWWPTLNGEGLWIESQDYWNEDNWVFSNVDWRPADLNSSALPGDLGANPPGFGKLAAPAQSAPQGERNPLKLIVISGDGNSQSQIDEFATDSINMLKVGKLLGAETTYLGPELALPDIDIDALADRKAPNDVHSRLTLFEQYQDSLEPGDTLLIYITGHGFVNDDGEGVAAGVNEVELQMALGPSVIDPGVNIILTIDACHSGAFKDTAKTYADRTFTSSSEEDPSYFDRDDENDPDPEDEGGEFSSGWVKSVKQIISDAVAMARIQLIASERAHEGVNFFMVLFEEVYLESLPWNAVYLTGEAVPTITFGQPSTHPVGVAQPVVLEDPLNDAYSCKKDQSPPGTAPEHVDLVSVGMSIDEEDNLIIIMEFSNSEMLTLPFLASIEFDDPTLPNSGPTDFEFSNKGEYDLSLYNLPPTEFYWDAYAFGSSGTWVEDTNLEFSAQGEGNTIVLEVPMENFLPLQTSNPEDLRWWAGVVSPDLWFCDHLGLDALGRAVGVLPAPLGGNTVSTGSLTFDDGVPVSDLIVSSGEEGEEMVFTTAVQIALGGDPGAALAQHIYDNYLAVTAIGVDPEGDAVACGTQDPALDAPAYVDILDYVVGIGKDGFGAVSVVNNTPFLDALTEDFLRDNDLHHNTYLGFPGPIGGPINPPAQWHPYGRTDSYDINHKFDAEGLYVTFAGALDGSGWTSVPYPKQAVIEGNITRLPMALLDLPEDSVFFLAANNFNTDIAEDGCAEDQALVDGTGEAVGDIQPLNLALDDARERLVDQVFPDGTYFGFRYELPANLYSEEGADPKEVSTLEMFQALGEALTELYPKRGSEFTEPDIVGTLARMMEGMDLVHGMSFDPTNDVTMCSGAPSDGLDLTVDISKLAVGSANQGLDLVVSIEFNNIQEAADWEDFLGAGAPSFGAGVEIRNPDLEDGPGRLRTNQIYYTTFQDGLRFDLYSEYFGGKWNTTSLEPNGEEPLATVELVEHLLTVQIPGTQLADGADIYATSTNFGLDVNCFQDVVDTRAEVTKEAPEGLEFVNPRDYFLGVRLRF